jgi:hypothetical protein
MSVSAFNKMIDKVITSTALQVSKAKELRAKQAKALEDYDNGVHGWPELQTMLQLSWEQICKITGEDQNS